MTGNVGASVEGAITISDVTAVISGIMNSTGLTFDVVRERVYWVTSAAVVESAERNGQTREALDHGLTDQFSGVDVFEDFVYISIASTDQILTLDKFSREGVCIH